MERWMSVSVETLICSDCNSTVPSLLGAQAGGADVVEIGMPFSDPLADGPTIQRSTQRALELGVTMDLLFDEVTAARAQGLTVPVVLMGYFNPMIAYGPVFDNHVNKQETGSSNEVGSR